MLVSSFIKFGSGSAAALMSFKWCSQVWLWREAPTLACEQLANALYSKI